MSGHSKWHSIKHKKGALDAKRGRLFTKILKEITVAARMGGGDIDGNPRLRTAVQTARDANMPKDTIERAVKKGAGELEGVSYEDFVFEGYGPAGVAIMVEGSTDNKNRTTPEMRHAFSKNGGNLGESGCVAWMFDRKGEILVPADGRAEDEAMEIALEAGADDFAAEEGYFYITTAPDQVHAVRQALEAKGLKVESSASRLIPKNTIKPEGKDAEKLAKLLSALEDHDDVTSVASNAELDPDAEE